MSLRLKNNSLYYGCIAENRQAIGLQAAANYSHLNHNTMITQSEVIEQKQRFDSFLSSTDLVKIGSRMMFFMFNDNEDGRYNQYCYIHRVLRLIAKVGGSYYYPASNSFYSEILRREALEKYIHSLPKK
jgi:hypothetical protein